MYCVNCGKEISDSAKFCSGCGMSVVPVQSSEMREDPKMDTPADNSGHTWQDGRTGQDGQSVTSDLSGSGFDTFTPVYSTAGQEVPTRKAPKPEKIRLGAPLTLFLIIGLILVIGLTVWIFNFSDLKADNSQFWNNTTISDNNLQGGN